MQYHDELRACGVEDYDMQILMRHLLVGATWTLIELAAFTGDPIDHL